MTRALIHDLYAKPMSGEAIEAASFSTIDRETPPHNLPAGPWNIVQRLIHTTGDPRVLDEFRISPDAIDAGIAALRRGSPIITDSNMARVGISIARLRTVCSSYTPDHVRCFVADPEVAADAKTHGLPRSLFAVRRARSLLDGAIACFGNAPVGLMELSRLVLEEGLRPALIIAMPVGFIHVVESKEESMRLGLPFVALTGRRGGSPMAVATIHALCTLAAAGDTP